MNRAQLEHIIRAASAIVGDDEIVVFGSQAILGQFPDAPAELLVSVEADVFPLNKPALADLIEGCLGELSPFHQAFGYYAQGIAEETATLPDGWRGRLVQIRNANTKWASGWCLEVHDLVLSKLVAGREKDRLFADAVRRHGLIDLGVLRQRLSETELPDRLRTLVEGRITRLEAA